MSLERKDVLVSDFGITGESYGKDKIGSILHSIHQKKFAMGETFKYNTTIQEIKENINAFF